MPFGSTLKALRISLGLTQSKAAKILSHGDAAGSPSKRTLEEWEAGRNVPMLVLQEGVLTRLRTYQKHDDPQGLPLYGQVPAGPLSDNPQLIECFLPIPVGKSYPRDAFALRVEGDSMIGKDINDCDIVVVHRDREAKNGDVVVALIDGQTTLKTLVNHRGKYKLRSENPKYKSPVLTDQSAIQAVMIDKL